MKSSRFELRRRYSCEEVYDRMEKGLCLFCDEPDIAGHDLKHMRSQILMIECDDDQIFAENELGYVALHHKEEHAKSVVEEHLTLPHGKNIEHLVGDENQNTLVNPRDFVMASGLQPSPSRPPDLNRTDLITSNQDEMLFEADVVKLGFKTDEEPVADEKQLLVASDDLAANIDNDVVVSVVITEFSPGLQAYVTSNQEEDRVKTVGKDYFPLPKEYQENSLPLIKSSKDAARVWEPGGLPARLELQDWPERYHNHDEVFELTLAFHGNCLQNVSEMLIQPRVRCDFILERWIGLETFEAGEKKEHNRFLGDGTIELAFVMEGCMADKVVRCLNDSSSSESSSRTFEKLGKTWRFKFKNISEAHQSTYNQICLDGIANTRDKELSVAGESELQGMPLLKVFLDKEKKNLRCIGDGNTMEKIYYLPVVEITWVLESEKLYLLRIEVERYVHILVWWIGTCHCFIWYLNMRYRNRYAKDLWYIIWIIPKVLDAAEFKRQREALRNELVSVNATPTTSNELSTTTTLTKKGFIIYGSNPKLSSEALRTVKSGELSTSPRLQVDGKRNDWIYNELMAGERLSLTKKSGFLKEQEQLEAATRGVGSSESNLGHIENSSSEFSVYEVFHLQRPPELHQAKGSDRESYQALSLSSLRTRMFSTREYCDRVMV